MTRTKVPAPQKLKRDVATFAYALSDVGIDMRYNTRLQAFEMTTFERHDWCPTLMPGKWTPVEDNVEDAVIERIAAQIDVDGKPLTFGADTWRRCRNAYCATKEVDPFLEWLKGLPEWDRFPRLDTWLNVTLGAEKSGLTSWAGRYILMAAVARTISPGCQADEMPVLIGPQGIGKDTAIDHLFPFPERQDWHGQSFSFGIMDQQKRLESVHGCVIAHSSEAMGLGKREVADIKAFITTRRDRGRKPYGHNSEITPRRFIMVASTNEGEILPNDDTGNRRFVPIKLGVDGRKVNNTQAWIVSNFLDTNRDQMWAEAMERAAGGEKFHLTDDLMAEQRVAAERHRNSDHSAESIVEEALEQMTTLFSDDPDPSWPDPSTEPFTIQILIAAWEKTDGRKWPHEFNSTRIGKGLKNLGFTKTRKRVNGSKNALNCWERVDLTE